MITNNCLKLILVFILLFIPGVNLIFYIFIWVSLCIYQSSHKIYIKNEKIIQKPFKNMIFCPEYLKKINQK